MNRRPVSAASRDWRKYLWVPAAALGLVSAVAFFVFLSLQKSVPQNPGRRIGTGKLVASYTLAFKPDSLYTQPKLGDKQACLLAYVDHITWNMQYDLAGFEGLPAEYEYSVSAHLVAHYSESNKYLDQDFILWQKDYPLVNPTKLKSSGDINSLTCKADVDLSQYAAFAKQVYDKSQVMTSNELDVAFHVRAVVHGPGGDIVDDNTVQMVLPMIDGLLLVSGMPEKADTLTMVAAPTAPAANYLPYLILSAALFIGMLAITLALLPKGKKPDEKEAFSRTVAKILKQYGERLVRLDNPLPHQQLATISIDGIGEMIKIADEIGQPVFYYKADTGQERKIEFYVFDSGRIYYMVLFGIMGWA